MNASASIPGKQIFPSWFRIAARIADLIPARKVRTPETRRDGDVPDTHSGSGKSVELTATEFHLKAPLAHSVKLAADFTDWERFSLDMMKSQDEHWFIVVPLPPGHYSYYFLIDGRRHNDCPRCASSNFPRKPNVMLVGTGCSS